MATDLTEARRRAWETRRSRYGAKGYGAGAYGLGKREAKTWPMIEYDGGYPIDASLAAFTPKRPPLDFAKAARWLMQELPRANENMLCHCDIETGESLTGQPVKLIRFSTLGWSGAESIVALIRRRFDMNHHILSWRRGGHFIFEIPTRYLCDGDSDA